MPPLETYMQIKGKSPVNLLLSPALKCGNTYAKITRIRFLP